MVQPEKGFVIKTKDVQTQEKEKVFVNMTSHSFVDPFEEKAIPQEDQDKLNCTQKGLRIPLSLGDRREESDKKGEPSLVYDVIWAPQTVKKCRIDPAFR